MRIKKVLFIGLAIYISNASAFLLTPEAALMTSADTYFDTYYFPTHPTEATQIGIHKYDAQLEDYSKNEIQREIKQLKKYETEFAAINPKSLNEQTQGDRELVLNSIRSELLTLQTIRPWEKNPDTYSSGITDSAFSMMKRNFAPAEDRLRSLIAREKQMPAALQQARLNLKNPPKVFTDIALEQLPDVISFFQKDVPDAFASVSDSELKKQFAASNDAVIKALLEYQHWLHTVELPKSHGDFRIGEAAYRKKLAYDEMVDMPLQKLLEIGMANLHQNQNEFKRVAKEIDATKTPQQILAELSANHPQPNQLLSDFSGTFDALIKFIHDKKIITIPSDVQPTMEETPPFMRATTFASMDTPGPFEQHAKEAFFNVTLPEKNWDQNKMNDYMKTFNYDTISNTAVHEAYPGHYVQFLWMHDVHDRVRQILGANTNSEGWAHYCEQMMLDEGFGAYSTKTEREAKMLRLGQLLDALLRNARFIVGIKLHTGKMSMDEAITFFEKEGYQPHTVGVMEVKRGTGDPTYLYYTLGKLQILKLRADVEKKEGKNFNLEKFHDDFMRQGSPPIKIVRKAMLGNDSATL